MTAPKRPQRPGVQAAIGRADGTADGMIAPVYEPLPQVDSRNIGSFRDAVTDSAERWGRVVVDCSCVVKMGVSAMRVLESVSRYAQVTVVNPNPATRLMATAFGLNVEVQGTTAK